MTPPNPLKPIQEALEKVLHESGLHDFGRSVSSIDDLTAEVQHVYQRVDDIERVLETIVPILERLTVVFEDIQSDLEPMSELASKIPGSGSRRRRRDKEAGRVPARAVLAAAEIRRDEAEGGRTPTASAPPTPSPGAPTPDPSAPAQGPDAADRSTTRGAGTSPPPAGDAPTSGGSVRPGATGYSPLGSQDRGDQH